ncbi:MAG: RNA polymerase factor sigma-54 [Bacteroidaceae bacterium]|nr:RNA polymerase factor sigma-54 [Bacteroidaceae bacterium]
MGVSQSAYQVLTQQQQLRLSPQQLLTVKMLELPVAELTDNVKNELLDNVALDEGLLKTAEERDEDNGADETEGGVDEREETDEFESSDTLYDYDPDDLPAVSGGGETEKQEIPVGATKSFMDDMMEQMVNYDLTDEQYTLVEYLIYSLDNRGFLSRPIPSIVDDMLINHNIYTDEEEVEKALKIVQQFDPAGIGARDTRECLLLQIDRILGDSNHQSFEKLGLLQDARDIIDRHYDLFINNNVAKLQTVTGMNSVHLSDVLDTIKKLNLHPGLALSESAADSVQLAVPDFIVETDSDGNVTFALNNGDVPSLHVNQEYVRMLDAMQKTGEKLGRHDKERMTYYQQKVDAARMFIKSIRQRQQTLETTMAAIIDLQRQFFLSQNDDDLQKLIMEDVAKKTGLDVSTISRVCNGKYALVDGTLYPMSYFFKRVRTNKKGEDVDSRKVETAMRDIIDGEDKRNPYSDNELVEQLRLRGIDIERRTVNRYRSLFGIPTALKRKSI